MSIHSWRAASSPRRPWVIATAYDPLARFEATGRPASSHPWRNRSAFSSTRSSSPARASTLSSRLVARCPSSLWNDTWSDISAYRRARAKSPAARATSDAMW